MMRRRDGSVIHPYFICHISYAIFHMAYEIWHMATDLFESFGGQLRLERLGHDRADKSRKSSAPAPPFLMIRHNNCGQIIWTLCPEQIGNTFHTRLIWAFAASARQRRRRLSRPPSR